MRPLIAFLALVLAGCASPAMDPDLSLHDRFVLTALTDDAGRSLDQVWRWEAPIFVEYNGPPEYHRDVADHLEHLGQITGLGVAMDSDYPNVFIEISDRETGYTCMAEFPQGAARIHIWSALAPAQIRQCILQEMTQAMGPGGDLDGPFGSRDDTVFASWGGADHLTDQDIAVLRILYHPRLHSRLPREVVLERLPEIIADIYPEQAAR